jgi:hypothetical protein
VLPAVPIRQWVLTLPPRVRYLQAWPAVGQNRLQRMPDGTVVLELRRRWTDGTTHLIFDPVDLLGRLAALVPRPRINLVLLLRGVCRTGGGPGHGRAGATGGVGRGGGAAAHRWGTGQRGLGRVDAAQLRV